MENEAILPHQAAQRDFCQLSCVKTDVIVIKDDSFSVDENSLCPNLFSREVDCLRYESKVFDNCISLHNRQFLEYSSVYSTCSSLDEVHLSAAESAYFLNESVNDNV